MLVLRESAPESSLPRKICLPALSKHGSQLLAAGRIAEAEAFFEQILSIDPKSTEAHSGLYRIASTLGDRLRAGFHLGMAMQWPAIFPLPCHSIEKPIPILMFLSIDGCNTLLLRYLNQNLFQIHIAIVEFLHESTVLPPHNLVINAIGDADVRSEALAATEHIIARTSAPIINSPAQVLETGRCRIADRLATIPGVLTARSVLFPREYLTASTSGAMLREQGFDFPLLIRSPGYHMGQNFIRIETPSALSEAISDLPGSDLIVMQHLDGRGTDGNFRKYRVMMIDSQLYPVHLAIAKHWKIHYFHSDMADSPAHRAEEARFLTNMEGALGPLVMRALTQIEQTLALDYGGIDFGLNQNGQLLLYEANATMAVRLPDSDPMWDYRRRAIERIYTSIQQLFLSRSSAD